MLVWGLAGMLGATFDAGSSRWEMPGRQPSVLPAKAVRCTHILPHLICAGTRGAFLLVMRSSLVLATFAALFQVGPRLSVACSRVAWAVGGSHLRNPGDRHPLASG